MILSVIKKLLVLLAILIFSVETARYIRNTGYRETIYFHDMYLKKQVLQKLRSQNINFKLEGDSIWYSHEEGIKITKIYDKALRNFPITYVFATKDSEKKFMDHLKKLDIPVLDHTFEGDKYFIRISKQYKDKIGYSRLE